MGRKFTEQDSRRVWGDHELAALSECEMTILTFKRDARNLAIFVPLGGLILWVVSNSSGFGQVIGWVGVALFALGVTGVARPAASRRFRCDRSFVQRRG